jgi:23S rRNA pseudouridine1911/1915/1917 synthase
VNHELEKVLYVVGQEGQEVRLDLFLSERLNGLSRSRIQTLIKSAHIRVNDLPAKVSCKLRQGDRILVSIPAPPLPNLEPEALYFGIIHEDDSILVLNKPQGMVVHPGPGHDRGTLVHGLLEHCSQLSGMGGYLRPGIVHRLDKDTSGLMVVAKSDRVHAFLSEQFKSGEVKKEYVALVNGLVEANEGKIDLSVGRHPLRRKEMAVASAGGRPALTLWKTVERFQSGFSLLSVTLKTGRTHQIRVHLSHLGHPVVGDQVYGHGLNRWKRNPLYRKGFLPDIRRQMLHSRSLGFIHPDQDRYIEFYAPLPEDMGLILSTLKLLDSDPHGKINSLT